MELGDAENDPGSNPAASSAFRSSSDAAHAADPDLIYLEDIVGYSATVDGRTGARVEEFIDGDNPLFRLSLDGREVYVPAVDEFITELDSDTCTITFDLPAGLLDIYLE